LLVFLQVAPRNGHKNSSRQGCVPKMALGKAFEGIYDGLEEARVLND
jgi:hypothetical protein